MAHPPTLLPADLDCFIEQGYCVLRGAYSPELMAALLDRIWPELPEKRDDPSTWKRSRTVLQKHFEEPRMANPAVLGALDLLLGPKRYGPPTGTGYIPLSFPGFDTPPWQPPSKGWHVDGVWFQHRLLGREQALVLLPLMTPVAPGDGGTVLRLGSHLLAMQVLAGLDPAGVHHQVVTDRLHPLTANLPVIEVTGEAGDLLIMHGHAMHAGSPNCSNRVRFIGNQCINLHADVAAQREPASETPYERTLTMARERGVLTAG